MSRTTLRIMAGVEQRLNTLLRLETTACGFDERIRMADRQRTRLEKYIEREVERLVSLIPGTAGREL